MLEGIVRYRDEHIGEVEFKVYARDSFDDFRIFFMNDDLGSMAEYMKRSDVFDKEFITEDMRINPELMHMFTNDELQKGYHNPVTKLGISFDNRRLDIKKASKFQSNITNKTFASRVSALFHYISITGRKNYNQNISLETHGEFNTKREVHLEGFGRIEYDMGLITSLDIRGKYVDMQLRHIEESYFDGGIFNTLKEKDNFGNKLSLTPIKYTGFKLTEELLGFVYEPPIAKESINLLGMYESLEEVEEAHPDKNIKWIKNRKYYVVSEDMLEDVMKEFNEYDGFIAFDTETTGLKINFKSRSGEADQLVGVVLSKEIGTGYYFPLQQKRFKNLCDGDHWYFMEKYMKTLLETKKIVCHNIQFDWKVAYIYDINVNCVYDTMLAFGVTKRYEHANYQISLKALTRNIFGLDMLDLKDFVMSGDFGSSGITFADLPYDLVAHYAPTDGDMTLALFEFIEKEALLDKYGAHTIFEMEVTFAMMAAYAEFYGYRTNTSKIPALEDEIIGGMEKYKQLMFKEAGREFNPNSPKQLSAIMYDELGIQEVGDKRSTGKETLKTLSGYYKEDGTPLYPFVGYLKSYRQYEGIYKNFLKRLHEFATEDGFIFSSVKPLGTDTGRSSTGDPNYQSYNDEVKKNIVPREGFIHFDCDFSQIEYRVLASLAKQQNLIEAFKDADLDYHSYQASRMFSVPYALVTKALRGQSKGINFGLPYGMGDSSLGMSIFGIRNDESRRKASGLRRKFFEGQENIESFFETTRTNGVAQGYTSTYFGRRRYYHRSVFSVASIRRQAGNHVIQGTAADVYKLSCNRLFRRIIQKGWLGKVLINCFVHDELVIELHRSINPYEFFKVWREEFQLEIEGFCPLFAGAGVGMNWYDAKKQDLPVQYIEEIISKYHEGMEWDEDVAKFLVDVDKGHEEYKFRRVRDYITAEENQGEVIKPIINTLLVEKVGDITKKVLSSDEMIALYNKELGKDVFKYEVKPKFETLDEYLKVFALHEGLDAEKISIKSPDEADAPSNQDVAVEEEELVFDDYKLTFEDIIRMKGYYMDESKDILYITDKAMMYEGIQTTLVNYIVHKQFLGTSGRYQISLYNEQTKKAELYNAFISESNYQLLTGLYTRLMQGTTLYKPVSYS